MKNKINMVSWAHEMIQSSERMAIPIMTHPGIEMGGATVNQALHSGKVQADAIIRLNEAFPAAAATSMMDLTLEAEAFGCQVEFTEDHMPHLTGRLVSTGEEIENLMVPDLTKGRVPQFLEAMSIAFRHIQDKPLLGGCIGPFSLAGRLFGVSEIMVACYLEPAAIATLLEKCTDFLIQYCRAIRETGCAGVIIAEPAAGLLSNDDCLTFSSAYVKQMAEAVQDDSFMIVLHNCGNSGHCTGAMLQTGAGALHFGNAIDMVAALDDCPSDRLIMGNIDPVGVMKMRTPSEVSSFTADLLTRTASYKNFVLSTGCDLPPQVPRENLTAFFEALERHNERFRRASLVL